MYIYLNQSKHGMTLNFKILRFMIASTLQVDIVQVYDIISTIVEPTPNAFSRCFKSSAARLVKSKFSDMFTFVSNIFILLSTLSSSRSHIAGTTLLRYRKTEGQNLEGKEF